MAWRWTLLIEAPVVMVMAMVAAITLAVGHDRFYHSLAGATTDHINQTFSSNVGTLFAFLIKAFLGIAISTAYAQLLWSTFLKQTLKVSVIDALSSLTSNAIRLLDVRLYWRYPLLTLLAICSWTIALTAIFPPGSLAVVIEYRPSDTSTSIPVLDWKNTTLVPDERGGVQVSAARIELTGVRPIPITTILASQIARQGEMATASGPINSSYQLSFIAPSLQCDTRSWTAVKEIWCAGNSTSGTSLSYVSWLTAFGTHDSSSVFDQTKGAFPEFTQDGPAVLLPCGEKYSPESVSTGVFTGNAPALYIASKQDSESDSRAWNITTCRLMNSTYTAQVAVRDQQSIKLLATGVTELPAIGKEWLQSLNSSEDISNLISTMSSGGSAAFYGSGFRSDSFAYPQWTQMFGAYGLLEVIGSLVNGISSPFSEEEMPEILKTRLAFSDELRDWAVGYYSADGVTSNQFGLIGDATTSRLPLAPMMEELFRNITFGIMTSARIASMQDVPISLLVPTSVYTYTWQRLWISYAVGIGVTALISILGLFTILDSGHSYTTKFSTFLRTTPWEQQFQASDSGADPLPQKSADTRIRLGGSVQKPLSLVPRPRLGEQTESKQGLLQE